MALNTAFHFVLLNNYQINTCLTNWQASDSRRTRTE